nr:MAG TPA: hypothetical protein [Bacteriophage sp.]
MTEKGGLRTAPFPMENIGGKGEHNDNIRYR